MWILYGLGALVGAWGVSHFTGMTFMESAFVIAVIWAVQQFDLGNAIGAAMSRVERFFRSLLEIVKALAIFIAFRFVVAKVFGIFPADTYDKVLASGGWWTFGGHDISTTILFELVFGIVAGKLAMLTAQGRSKTGNWILAGSLVVILAGKVLPHYVASYPSFSEIDDTLVEKGGVTGMATDTAKSVTKGAIGAVKGVVREFTPTGNRNTSAAPQAAPQEQKKPWAWRTLDIPADGLAVYLYPGWEDHALGGNITITTPNGVVLKDEPGAEHDYGQQPEGIYIIRADGESAKRVQIKNRW